MKDHTKNEKPFKTLLQKTQSVKHPLLIHGAMFPIVNVSSVLVYHHWQPIFDLEEGLCRTALQTGGILFTAPRFLLR